jgi:hypothetical protein
MIPKSDLRHNSLYLYKGKLFRYNVEEKHEWLYTNEYIISLEKIKLTEEIFDIIKASIREILDESFRGSTYASIILHESGIHYVFKADQLIIKHLYFLHEVQNLISEIYDKELKINDKRLSDIIKLAHV